MQKSSVDFPEIARNFLDHILINNRIQKSAEIYFREQPIKNFLSFPVK